MKFASALIALFLLGTATACEHGKAKSPAQEVKPKADAERGPYELTREQADDIADKLANLDEFPLKLSTLESKLGLDLDKHFTAESKSRGFEHDGRGPTGPNVGGKPLSHSDEALPLVLELRSQYYVRYDKERRFDNVPPKVEDNPVIDRIVISDSYTRGAPPKMPADARLLSDEQYPDSGEEHLTARVGHGFLTLKRRTKDKRAETERWQLILSMDRGSFFEDAEVKAAEAVLIELFKAVDKGENLPAFFTDFEKRKPNGMVTAAGMPFSSHNPRYFNASISEGDLAGEFLKKEGRSEYFSNETYIQGEVKVAMPAFINALGIPRATLAAAMVPSVHQPEPDGSLIYYDAVRLEKGYWKIRLTGFYPSSGGTAPADLDLAKFRFGSVHMTWAKPAK